MSTQIVRLSNGDSIQVRTGVLRGVGPAGPTGPANTLTIGTVTEGTADATISGTPPNQTLNLVLPTSTVPGPTGSIADYLTKARVTSSLTAISADTERIITFQTVDLDELSMVSSSTVFDPVPVAQADRVISGVVSVTFSGLATNTGYRSVYIKNGSSTVLTELTVACNPKANASTTLVLPFIERFTASDTFSVYVQHGAASQLSVTAGFIKAIRVGAGPTGPQGPSGPSNTLSIGTVSTLAYGQNATATITGSAPTQTLNLGLPMGAQGPAGDASGGFSTIAGLDGTGGNV